MALVIQYLEVKWPTAQKPHQALDQLQLQRVRRDPPWGVGVLDGVAEPDRVSDAPEVPDVLQGPTFGVSDQAGLCLLLELAASLEEASHICESAVGGIAVAELAEVAPPLARLEVVMAEVGLAEAALVGLAALEVVVVGIAQSLFFVVCSTRLFYLSLLASSFSFYDAQLSNLFLHLEY